MSDHRASRMLDVKNRVPHERGDSLTRVARGVALTTAGCETVAVGQPGGAGTAAETWYVFGRRLSPRQPPMAGSCPSTETVALSGASTTSEPTVRTGRCPESFRAVVSKGVVGGAGVAGGGTAATAAESGCLVGGNADSALRDLENTGSATAMANAATSPAPTNHGVLRFFVSVVGSSTAACASDRTMTVGSAPVMRVRYADVSSVCGNRVTSSCASNSPVAGRSSACFCRQCRIAASNAGVRSGLMLRGGGGGSSTCCRAISYQSSPSNGN